MANKNPYYFFCHEREPYLDEETFYDSNDFDWTINLTNQWRVIHDEVFQFLEKEQDELKPYFAKELYGGKGGLWVSFSFYFWGLPMSKKAISNCPKTIDILQKVPGLVTASISILDANTEIYPHYGDTDAIYRCHLGLDIPEGLPNCGFRVGYEDRAWGNGKMLIFNDATYHKAWNNTDEKRVILLLDVVKPQYIKDKKKVCATLRGGLSWKKISIRLSLFDGKKNLFTRFMCHLFFVWNYRLIFFLKRKSSLLK